MTKRGCVGLLTALVWLVVPDSMAAQTGALPTSDARALILQALGEAYAKDVGVALVKADIALAGRVDVPETWRQRLEQSLAVGYVPSPGVFRTIPYSVVRPVMDVKAAHGRSPAEALQRAVIPGAVVIQTTWHFAGAAPVQSYAVFSADGKPLFETLILLPALRGRVFSAGH
jgi:hypothetical protein